MLRRSSIIVLDEATSALDSVTEKKLLAAVTNAFKDRTVITIAVSIFLFLIVSCIWAAKNILRNFWKKNLRNFWPKELRNFWTKKLRSFGKKNYGIFRTKKVRNTIKNLQNF